MFVEMSSKLPRTHAQLFTSLWCIFRRTYIWFVKYSHLRNKIKKTTSTSITYSYICWNNDYHLFHLTAYREHFIRFNATHVLVARVPRTRERTLKSIWKFYSVFQYKFILNFHSHSLVLYEYFFPSEFNFFFLFFFGRFYYEDKLNSQSVSHSVRQIVGHSSHIVHVQFISVTCVSMYSNR